MTNFDDRPEMCRVDFFNPRGDGFKWYATESFKFEPWAGSTFIHDAFRDSLLKHLDETSEDRDDRRMIGMLAVCLEPHHQNAHPLTLYVPSRHVDDVHLHTVPIREQREGFGGIS